MQKSTPSILPSSDSNQSVAKTLLRGTLWSTIGNGANQAIGFVCGIVLTRMLDAEIFGAFALATYWVGLLNVRQKLGLYYAALEHPRTTSTLLGTYRVLDMLSALVNLIIAAVAAAIIARSSVDGAEWVSTAIVALAFAEAISTVTSVHTVALERELQLSRNSLATLFGTVLAYSVALTLAYFFRNISSLIAVASVSYLVVAAASYLFCRRRLPGLFAERWHFDRELAGQLLKHGAASGLGLAILGFVATFDNFLIHTYFGSKVTGFYDRAYRIASWPALVIALAVSRSSFLAFGRFRSMPAQLAHTLRLTIWGVFISGLPLMLTLIIGAPDIVRGFYGQAYIESVRYVRFLGITNFLLLFANLGFWLAAATGRPHVRVVIAAIQGLCMLTLGVLLTHSFGVFGTLAGVGTASLLGAIASGLYIHRRTGVNVVREFSGLLLSTTAVGGILMTLSRTPIYSTYDLEQFCGTCAPALHLARATSIAAVAFAGVMGLTAILDRQRTLETLRYLRGVWSDRHGKPNPEAQEASESRHSA